MEVQGRMNSSEPKHGRMILKAFGHAKVYVDGLFAGFSDELQTLELAEGAHDIVVVEQGTEAHRLEVRVCPGAASLVLPGLVMTVRS